MRRAAKYIIYAYVAAMSCMFIYSIIVNSLNQRDPFYYMLIPVPITAFVHSINTMEKARKGEKI